MSNAIDIDACIAIRKHEHYYKLHADGRVVSAQAEVDLTFGDITLMCQTMNLTLPGQGYPSADAAMRAGILVRDLHAPSADLDVDDVFDFEETIRLRRALTSCPPHQRDAAMDRMRDWRIRESILQTLLDGLTEIHGVDGDGDPILGLTSAGRGHATSKA